MCQRTGPVGLARSHHCLDVSAGPRWSSAVAVPLLLAKQGSSSRELRSPSEFLLAVTCPRASPPRAPPLGFRPSSRHQLEESSTRRTIPRSPAFRPQRFTRSRRFAPPRALRACFIALPCPGFQLQGFPLTNPAASPRRRPFPSRRWQRRLPVARRQRIVTSTSGSCSGSVIRSTAGVFKPERYPCPLVLFSLPQALGP